MMWRNRRLWLLLTAVFLLRDAAGLGVWNAKSAQPWYGGAASVSMDQPTKVNYLPGLTKLEGSISSDASMPSSLVLPQQGLGPSPIQAGPSTCGSSSQMAVTASGSAGSSQSVFPGGQQVSGLLVSQPQLQGSSGVVGTWRQSDVGTPQISSHLFQQGAWHQGSSSSLSTPQGSYGAVSSGLIKYLPAEKPHPSIPQQPQSAPQLPHPSQTKPVGGVSASTPLQGSSGSSAWIPTGLLGHPLASQHSSGSSSDAPQEGPYGPLPVQGGGTRQTTGWQTAQSPMPSSGLTLTKYYGPQYSQGVGAWLPSSHDQPSVQSALSQMAASHGKSGATTVQQVSSDALPAQGANIWSSSPHQAALQTASSLVPDLGKGSDLTPARDAPQSSGSSYRAFPSPVATTWKTWQSSRDVPQQSSYYSYPHTQGTGTGQPSSHSQNQPLVQTQVGGSCVCPPQQPAQDTVQKSSSISSLVAPPSWISKTWQTSKLPSGLEMGKLQFGSGTTSQQSSSDAAQTSSSSYGFLPPQVVSTWQTSSFQSPPQTVLKHDAHNPAQHGSHSVLNQASPSGQTPSSAHGLSTKLRGW